MGAGRGGILEQIFLVADQFIENKKIFVYLIEKNKYAIRSLNYLLNNNEKYKKNCQIIHGDIRNLEIIEKADILLSELLGGFGDNELSPELIYESEKFLNKFK